jgi:hypothetical protein
MPYINTFSKAGGFGQRRDQLDGIFLRPEAGCGLQGLSHRGHDGGALCPIEWYGNKSAL